MVDKQACNMCSRINEGESISKCKSCGSTNLSDKWAGIVVISEPNDSRMAEEMGVDEPGTYALKIR